MRKIYIHLLIFMVFAAACRKSDPIGKAPETAAPVLVSQTGLLTTSTDFPTADEAFTLTFDAAKGNAALQNISSDIYIYTGVITDKSTGASDWKYVKSASFSSPDPAAKMTPIGNGKFQISLSPRSFYGVPAGEQILQLVMLFRTGDGKIVGRNKDQSDLYLPIYEAGKLGLRFKLPEFEPTFNPVPVISIQMVGEELSISAAASKAATLNLSLDGVGFASATNAKEINGKVKVNAAGRHELKLSGTDGVTTTERSFTFLLNGTVEIAELPAGAKEGVVFINGGKSAILTLYAPLKQYVYAIGDFNDWQSGLPYFMKKTPDGHKWWVQIDNLQAGKEYAYQYLVDGKLRIADPYAEKLIDPQYDAAIPSSSYPVLLPYPTGKTSGILSVMQSNQPAYSWKYGNFKRPEKNDLVIYELHLRDFLKNANYNTLRDTLDYLARLKVNAIELMPVNEFEGNSSWGYNPSFYFAPDKYYGTKAALQQFIDECHGRGIAVIMDMVLNHSFGQSPMVQLYFDEASGKPAANSPWFNATPTHPFNVGYDFNHESPATKSFVRNVLKFWMDTYRVDGFRFDLSKGFTQKNSGTGDGGVTAWSAYDPGRVAIWKDYNSFIKTNNPDNFYVILEHFAADAEEKELSEEGMMFWNNVNASFNQATMGYQENSDFSRAFSGTHGFSRSENLISYMESHDEERLMFKNLSYGNSSGSYNVKTLATALKRQEMAAAFFFSIPGPKMLWQFGELGYDVSIEQNGRTGEKPIHWDYLQQAARWSLKTAYASLINYKTNNSIFKTGIPSYNLSGPAKYLKLTNADNTVVVVGNFDVIAQSLSVDFGQPGTWLEWPGGNSMSLTGNTYTKTLSPGEYHIYSRKPLYLR